MWRVRQPCLVVGLNLGPRRLVPGVRYRVAKRISNKNMGTVLLDNLQQQIDVLREYYESLPTRDEVVALETELQTHYAKKDDFNSLQFAVWDENVTYSIDDGKTWNTVATGATGPQGPAGVIDQETLSKLATSEYVQTYEVPVSQIKGGSTVFNSSNGTITGVKTSAVSGLDNMMTLVGGYDCTTSTATGLVAALIDAGIITASCRDGGAVIRASRQNGGDTR